MEWIRIVLYLQYAASSIAAMILLTNITGSIFFLLWTLFRKILEKCGYSRLVYLLLWPCSCLFILPIVHSCKCQYKNVGKVENNYVGLSAYSSAA